MNQGSAAAGSVHRVMNKALSFIYRPLFRFTAAHPLVYPAQLVGGFTSEPHKSRQLQLTAFRSIRFSRIAKMIEGRSGIVVPFAYAVVPSFRGISRQCFP